MVQSSKQPSTSAPVANVEQALYKHGLQLASSVDWIKMEGLKVDWPLLALPVKTQRDMQDKKHSGM